MNPSKRQEPREEITIPPTENGKKNADNNGKTERVCYETKIIGGVVVRTPVRKVSNYYYFHKFVHRENLITQNCGLGCAAHAQSFKPCANQKNV